MSTLYRPVLHHSDVLSTIKNFRSINPNGVVVLVGHSQGADNIIEMAKENPDVKLDLVITLDLKDAANLGTFSIDDDNVPVNVKMQLITLRKERLLAGKK